MARRSPAIAFTTMTKKKMPNNSRQPMPGGRHDCIHTPWARHGCAVRSATLHTMP
jgi:hypothetical protein